MSRNYYATGDPHMRHQEAESDGGRLDDLVLASRILVNEGVLDGFGHVSVRSASNPNRMFMPRAMPPGLVTAEDIVELDLDGNPVDPNAPRTNGERYIHSEIYKARPDVQSIVHAHTLSVLPFSLLPSVPMRPVVNLAGFLADPVPVFEPRKLLDRLPKARGKLQVNTPELGRELAGVLGAECVVLLRGHGNVVVGGSVRWMTYRAVYTDLNARAQRETMQMGTDLVVMDQDELEMHAIEVFDVNRPWDYWRSRLPALRTSSL